MKDIILDKSGDMLVTDFGDIRIGSSIIRDIKMALLYILGEYKWDPDLGLPWMEMIYTKNPRIEEFKSLVEEAIFNVEDVIAVDSVEMDVDPKTRKAVIRFVARTDEETIREEVEYFG